MTLAVGGTLNPKQPSTKHTIQQINIQQINRFCLRVFVILLNFIKQASTINCLIHESLAKYKPASNEYFFSVRRKTFHE